MLRWIIIALILIVGFAVYTAWQNRHTIPCYWSIPGGLLLGAGLYSAAFALANLSLIITSHDFESANWFSFFSGIGAIAATICLTLAGIWGLMFQPRLLYPRLKESALFAGAVTMLLLITSQVATLNWW